VPIDVGSSFSLAVGPSTDAVPVQEVNDFESIQIKFHLYDGDSVSFGLDAKSSSSPHLSGLASDCWLYRGTTLWQRFRVLPIAQSWDEDGNSPIGVQGVCYKQVLKARYLHAPVLFPTTTDQGSIIWSLIFHTQGQTNGSLGITQGSTTTGVTRVRNEYKTGDHVYKLIDDLTKVINGPVWRVAPVSPWVDGGAQKVLTVRQPSSFLTGNPAVLGDNIQRLSRDPSDQFANSGYGVGNANIEGYWYDHPTLAADLRGRWEATASASTSATEQTNVIELAQGLVTDRIKPPSAWTLEVRTARWLTDSGYMPGDFVPVKVPPSAVDPLDPVPENAAMVTIQVIETTLTVTADGGTTVTVSGSEV